MADEKNTNTGGGANTDGNIGTGGGDFVGRDKAETQATGNVVNMNFPHWTPDRAHGQGDGLSHEAEDRLQQNINSLNKEVANLNGNIIALTGALQNEVTASKDRSEAVKKLVDMVADAAKQQAELYIERVRSLEKTYNEFRAERDKEQKNERPLFDKRTSNLLLISAALALIFLGIMAWTALSRNAPTVQVNGLHVATAYFWIVRSRFV